MHSQRQGKKVGLVSLGCPKNLVDSEVILGGLIHKDGYVFCQKVEESDIIIINTCGFLEASKQESIEVIEEILELKKVGSCKAVIVIGCLVQRFSSQLKERFKEVDAFLDASHLEDVGDVIANIFHHEEHFQLPVRKAYLTDHHAPLFRLTAPHYSYIKISDGCDNPCSFCTIPRIRGRFRSRSITDIIEETQKRVETGAKEIILIAQDLTEYGRDIYKKPSLPLLLEEMVKIHSVEWIRLMYTYPYSMSDGVLECISTYDKICNYVDMPLQHIDQDILTAMGRRGDEQYIRNLINKMYSVIPNLALRTTFITGFPGETESQFQRLLDFMADVCFDRVGIFCYSNELSTRSVKLPDQVSGELMRERQRRGMMLQQTISEKNNRKYIGHILRVHCDRRCTDNGQLYEARSYRDAPEIDGLVFIHDSEKQIKQGDMMDVRIMDATQYDLIACKE
ncbi:MAG: 30S ribosomal protein S12 methylthiotransferase RimO [Chlamydiota bacterium]|nr:30S ribosomal protein S12 methylthiotransferase RimO [Chlamydiota bacterium]